MVDDCPIWQACQATSAAPTFFPPMVIGRPPTAYVDGGLGYNNPIRLLVEEARHIWPASREIGCIVSVGTGILASRDIGRTIQPLFESLKGMATDTEKTAREFKEEMKHKYGVNQVYFRFNVQNGLEQVGLEEWKELDRTKVATEEYLIHEWSQVDTCATQLQQPREKDLISRMLDQLQPALSALLQTEMSGNRLRFDSASGGLVVSIPSFQKSDFPEITPDANSHPCGSSFISSTFNLTHLLEILPGQRRHTQAQFEDKNVNELGSPEQPYLSKCSRSGLTRLICRFFNSVSQHHDVTEIRTSVGRFTLQSEGFRTLVRFFPLGQGDHSPAHHLSNDDFDAVRRSAQGKLRLTPEGYQSMYEREHGSEDDLWIIATLDNMTSAAGLSVADCIRFISEENINTLQNIRDFAQQLMNGFIRVLDEKPDSFDEFESAIPALRTCATRIIAGAESTHLVTDASAALISTAYPDLDVMTRRVKECWDTYLDMLEEFRQHPGETHSTIRATLRELLELHGAGYVCVVVFYGLLVRTNCTTILERAVQAPQLWLHMVAHPEGEVLIA